MLRANFIFDKMAAQSPRCVVESNFSPALCQNFSLKFFNLSDPLSAGH